YKAIPGFHASLDSASLKEIQAAPEVAYVEQDAVMKIAGQEDNPPSWGLTRVSQRNLDLSQPYFYNNAAGNGITAYVVDTGVYVEHSDFGGRARVGVNFVTGSPDTDQNGHGTHVSGTIGGTTYGVAKQVKIVGVKVLDEAGSGSVSNVIAGIDWIKKYATAGKSVVNMSLGGPKTKSLNDAAASLYDANIPLIVAAGNDATVNSCDVSPAGAPHTFAVAASDQMDTVATFTSFGSCVSIFAPGVDITSAWIGGVDASKTISGTSMSAPHVAGVAALYLSESSIVSAKDVFDKLSNTATPGKIMGTLNGSPNKLVYNGGVH
ncbi:hypothetical protein BGZ58_002157, partial [Dissophora ornata]